MSGEPAAGAAQRGVARDEEARAGRWVEPAVSYIDPVRRFCGYCGRPLARRYWERAEAEERRAYCGPGHAARTTYPLS